MVDQQYNDLCHQWLVKKCESLNDKVGAIWKDENLRAKIQQAASFFCFIGVFVSSFFSMKGVGAITEGMSDNENSTLFYSISPAVLTNSITFSSLLLTFLTFPFVPNVVIKKIKIEKNHQEEIKLEKKHQDEIKRYLAAFAFCFGLYNFGVLYTACEELSTYNFVFFFLGILFGASTFVVFKPTDFLTYGVTTACLTAMHIYALVFYMQQDLSLHFSWVYIGCIPFVPLVIFSPLLWYSFCCWFKPRRPFVKIKEHNY